MRQALSISALARSAGVTSKTLRYWERVGLLPKAARTHTGYRIFGAEANHYIEFILKAKSVGLTLAEMKRVIEFARQGKSPCPQVVQWIDEKDRAVEQQIHSLRALQRRLWWFLRICSISSVTTCAREEELGCLIEDLPNPQLAKGDGHEKALLACSSSSGRARS
jgi:MerR family transcriptional regulator, copper efflux regulator